MYIVHTKFRPEFRKSSTRGNVIIPEKFDTCKSLPEKFDFYSKIVIRDVFSTVVRVIRSGCRTFPLPFLRCAVLYTAYRVVGDVYML
jgi:hypothetical protein